MSNLLQDLRHSVRLLLKNPGFSLTAILVLALGIGADAKRQHQDGRQRESRVLEQEADAVTQILEQVRHGSPRSGRNGSFGGLRMRPDRGSLVPRRPVMRQRPGLSLRA